MMRLGLHLQPLIGTTLSVFFGDPITFLQSADELIALPVNLG